MRAVEPNLGSGFCMDPERPDRSLTDWEDGELRDGGDEPDDAEA